MTPEISGTDRVLGVVVGPAPPSFVLRDDGAARRFGLIGIAPWVNGVARRGPLHTMLGWQACSRPESFQR